MLSPSSLLPSNSSENDEHEDMFFDVAEYLTFNEELQEGSTLVPPPPCPHDSSLQKAKVDQVHTSNTAYSNNCLFLHDKSITKASSRGTISRVAFRTKSEHEILDDGYKWKKYGKKTVKKNSNPRNYYRCSTEGCNIKKRVERDHHDSSYVITTYEGFHNHHVPSPATALYRSASDPPREFQNLLS